MGINTTAIQSTILGQVHEQKPEWMIPGVHITVAPGDFSKIDHLSDEEEARLAQDDDAIAEAIKDDNAVSFVIMGQPITKSVIRYERGPDLYSVTRYTRNDDEAEQKWSVESFDGIFADQLGELLFGTAAEPMQTPMFSIIMLDPETGAVERMDF